MLLRRQQIRPRTRRTKITRLASLKKKVLALCLPLMTLTPMSQNLMILLPRRSNPN